MNGGTQMSKLLNAALAAALGFGLNAAMAQNVDSDKDKAHEEDRIMQEKEKGATSGADEAGAGQSGQGGQDTKTMPVPAQSADTVGRPAEREPTGQGHGVKEQNQQSGQSSDQPIKQ
jgi:hypothetical protein